LEDKKIKELNNEEKNRINTEKFNPNKNKLIQKIFEEQSFRTNNNFY
jgi:hypothetical protein